MAYDLLSLTLFISVAETGSIAAAAARHHVAASAVSRRMNELETQTRTTLLYRKPRGVSLTPAGAEFLRHAQSVQRQISRLDRAMEIFAEGMRGDVRIAANTSSITQFLPEDFSRFATLFPQIRIRLVEMFSTEVVAAIRAGRADLGICSGLTDTGDLERLLYRRDTLVLAMRPDHPLAKAGPATLDDILDQDIVSLQEGSSIRAYVDAQAALAGHHLRSRVQVMSFDGVRRMVEAGLGVAILPHGAVIDAAERGTLAMVAIDAPWAQRDLVILRKPNTEHGRATNAMLDCLTGHEGD